VYDLLKIALHDGGAARFRDVYVSDRRSVATVPEGRMIKGLRNDDEARREDAAAWVVRLETGDFGDAEAIAFDAWLSTSAFNEAAFDVAMAISRQVSANAQPIAQALLATRTVRHGPDRRMVVGGFGIAAAAMLAVIVAPELNAPTSTETYATTKGERRSVLLADGSRVDLNAGTRLTVSLARDTRTVRLDQGQAVFDVAHDAGRPFFVTAGDRTVRVVGTQFDVRRREGKLSVTVARGAVEVRPSEGASGRAYRLRPGQRLDHVEGGPQTQVAMAEASEILAWRTGRLVYREQPLSEVIADLNQQWPTPIRIEDPTLGAVPVSGVLVLDNQDAVIRRLALLVPISAVRSEAGLILRRDTTSDR
jgi:transmembrane sensor